MNVRDLGFLTESTLSSEAEGFEMTPEWRMMAFLVTTQPRGPA
jgi:hypothetical protein